MAIGVGVTSNVGLDGGNASTTATTAGVTTQATGSVIVLLATWRNTRTFSSIADNKGNSASYVQIGTELDTGFLKCRMYYCENAAGGSGHTATITISGGTSEITLLFLEITGAATSGAFDKSARVLDASSPFTSGATATTTQAAELLVGGVFSGGDLSTTFAISGATPSSGWTLQTGAQYVDGQSGFAGTLATAVVSSTGAYEAGFTASGGGDGATFIATFKEAGGSGGSGWRAAFAARTNQGTI